MGTPRRRSSRLNTHTPQRNTHTSTLSTLLERETTPEHEQPNLAVAASAPSKISGIPKPIQWSTPSSRNLLKPDFAEMHPSHAQASINKLSFQQRSDVTSPTAHDGAPLKIKSQVETATVPTNPFSSPTFEFKHKRPSTEMSSEAQKLMSELRDNAARYKNELASIKEPDHDFEGISAGGRKMAKPKGKMGRYSDIHMKDFKKMNSIANHPSAYRAATTALATPAKSLKRTSSKAGLDKPDIPLERTSSVKSVHKGTSSGVTGTPIKRHKPHDSHAVSKEPQPVQGKPTARPADHKQSAIPGPPAFGTPTKASLARSASVKSIGAGPSKIPSYAKSPSVPSFMTPQPARVTEANLEGARNIRTSFANKIRGVKSILRRPQLRFSDDPVKLAAGTHVATPKATHDRPLPSLPEAPDETPKHRAEKHVNFSPDPDTIFQLSTRASSPADSPTPTPAKQLNASIPTPPALYASLAMPGAFDVPPGPVDFTFQSEKVISFSPKPGTPTIRRVRASDISLFTAPAKSKSGVITASKLFAAAPARFSDFPTVPHGIANRKRKRESDDIGAKDEDKENLEHLPGAAEEEEQLESPKKKARVMTAEEKKKSEPTKKPTGNLTKPSTVAAAKASSNHKKGFLSLSRLNALARPKNRG